MNPPAEFLNPSDAAKKLGVSAKALRIYEQRGLITPLRTAAGWRSYGPDEMRRAAEITALRSLGFSLAQIARVLDQDPQAFEQALAAHQAVLEGELRKVSARVEEVRRLRAELTGGQAPSTGELLRVLAPAKEPVVAFDLPWPWGGERFELREVRPLNYIIGPLFSGKTRLARRLAETMSNAAFLGLERLEDGGVAARTQLDADQDLRSRVDQALSWMVEDGATRSDALIALVAGLEADGADALVVDMVEQELDAASQQALIAYLRGRGANARPLFLTTRSCEILDLEAVGAHEAIILCPANHSPPLGVAPYAGAPGYEAVATCLASPEVRARTEGVIAWRPPAA
ncbi:MAG: MerR family transcriptional regulator [Alphaproteobacteria bacterium]|nr:MerR family transcriptional regulator [Alphaproteobacteria bacterium]